jgi:hypothetical protein
VQQIFEKAEQLLPYGYHLPQDAKAFAAKVYADARAVGLKDYAEDMAIAAALSYGAKTELLKVEKDAAALRAYSGAVTASMLGFYAKAGIVRSQTTTETAGGVDRTVVKLDLTPVQAQESADTYEYKIAVMARKQLNIFLPEDGYKMNDKIVKDMIADIKANKGLGLSDADMIERVLNKYQRDIFVDALRQYKEDSTMKFGEKFLLFFWTFTNDMPFGIGTIARAINESTALASADNTTVLQRLNEQYSNHGYKTDNPLKDDLLRGLSVRQTPLVIFSEKDEKNIREWVNENEAEFAVKWMTEILFSKYGISIPRGYRSSLREQYTHTVDSSRRIWLQNMRSNATVGEIYAYILEELADDGSTRSRNADYYTSSGNAEKVLKENNLLVNIDEVMAIVKGFAVQPKNAADAIKEATEIRNYMLNERVKALRALSATAPDDAAIIQALVFSRYDVNQAL